MVGLHPPIKLTPSFLAPQAGVSRALGSSVQLSKFLDILVQGLENLAYCVFEIWRLSTKL